jgi:hypothetical protein
MSDQPAKRPVASAPPEPETAEYEPPQVEEMPSDQSAATGAGINTQTSDRNAKHGFESVDVDAVLAGVVDLPLTSWSYKEDDPATRHVGPMAQDFAATFGVGDDDRHIHVVDANGVALAAIQALAKQLAETQARIGELEAEVERLRAPALV